MLALTDALLFPASSPGVVGELTVAVLRMLLPLRALCAATVTVTVCCAPFAMVPRLHSMRPKVVSAVIVVPGGTMILFVSGSDEQLPVDGSAPRKIRPGGSVSVMVTFSAALRPSAVTVAART